MHRLSSYTQMVPVYRIHFHQEKLCLLHPFHLRKLSLLAEPVLICRAFFYNSLSLSAGTVSLHSLFLKVRKTYTYLQLCSCVQRPSMSIGFGLISRTLPWLQSLTLPAESVLTSRVFACPHNLSLSTVAILTGDPVTVFVACF